MSPLESDNLHTFSSSIQHACAYSSEFGRTNLDKKLQIILSDLGDLSILLSPSSLLLLSTVLGSSGVNTYIRIL